MDVLKSLLGPGCGVEGVAAASNAFSAGVDSSLAAAIFGTGAALPHALTASAPTPASDLLPSILLHPTQHDHGHVSGGNGFVAPRIAQVAQLGGANAPPSSTPASAAAVGRFPAERIATVHDGFLDVGAPLGVHMTPIQAQFAHEPSMVAPPGFQHVALRMQAAAERRTYAPLEGARGAWTSSVHSAPHVDAQRVFVAQPAPQVGRFLQWRARRAALMRLSTCQRR
ncbi:hypothetical protein EON66_07670 [archaeon]|nr:MAG: hypothetical protein EON66_07670 [archaeon]